MKIAFLSFYSGVVYRGVETFVHELANSLTSLGNDVTVYQTGNSLPDANYKTIQIKVYTDWRKKGSYIPLVNYYAKKVGQFTLHVLKNIEPDIDIIFPTNGQWQSILCSIWAKKNGKKMIISGQSGPGMDDRINLFTFPNVFTTLTSFQDKWAKKANPFIQTEKIPNGVNITKFSKSKALNVDLPRPIILNVAALVDWKRQDLIIKAVSSLDKGSLLLVGQGLEKEKLEALGNTLLPGRFKIMSFRHNEMPSVYRTADVFTFPTVPWESFGIVLVEAMASGLPVVATDDPIRREIVGDAGVFVDPTNIEDYAHVIQNALNKKWGELPRKQAEKFSWDIIAGKYEELFKNLKK